MNFNFSLIYLTLPFTGFIVGSIKRFRFMPPKRSFIVFIISILIIAISKITSISFSFDFLDHLAVASSLLVFGYCGSRPNHQLNKGINRAISLFRTTLALSYIALPFVAYWLFIQSFGNDRLGRIVHIDNTKSYRIKHVCINSNFTYSGNHNVHVFRKNVLFEFQIDFFNLGQYGKYGFNQYVVENNKLISSHRFDYNSLDNRLILKKYCHGIYEPINSFTHNKKLEAQE